MKKKQHKICSKYQIYKKGIHTYSTAFYKDTFIFKYM